MEKEFYTIDEVIFKKDDPRIKKGDDCFFGETPYEALKNANNYNQRRLGWLKEVLEDNNSHPFIVFTKDRNLWGSWGGTNHACVVKKKELYKPFNLCNEETRFNLLGRKVYDTFEHQYFVINSIKREGYQFLINDKYNPKRLFEDCKFEDGSPCGEKIEE